ncbi:cyclin-dependent kinase inhibitor 2 isoform X2 [Ooceraea biroi]|nr:cyclin-dependent kinase inhibitor 2 isoform X2 [Ooceraea biroi]XP_011344753.1 cyclin-dependent kinase inhibitor 2 isoform X2 [Ooceraea biroi]XP_011344754.1 cyclin-dependent kinase inhibitor 2 isoform X2 [Ooceraea biroi]EZA50613.1 hypothetical protein X777_10964 [Ooceraea biroi]
MEERNTHKIRNVRRRLFQDTDDNNDGEGDNFVNRLLEEDRRQKELCKQRWNFDFEKEEPLPGRYEWVKLDDHRNEIPNSTMINDTVQNPQKQQSEEVESKTSDINETEKITNQ